MKKLGLLITLSVLIMGSSYAEEELTMLSPMDMTDWGTPKALLPGAKDYVLQGNPGTYGPYTIRLHLPAGFKIAPYTQSSTTFITVLSGDYHMGVGSTFNVAKGKELVAGSFVIVPPDVAVYAWTTADTVLQIHGVGPWDVKYLNN